MFILYRVISLLSIGKRHFIELFLYRLCCAISQEKRHTHPAAGAAPGRVWGSTPDRGGASSLGGAGVRGRSFLFFFRFVLLSSPWLLLICWPEPEPETRPRGGYETQREARVSGPSSPEN